MYSMILMLKNIYLHAHMFDMYKSGRKSPEEIAWESEVHNKCRNGECSEMVEQFDIATSSLCVMG